ncbi:hypothetical protein RB619_04535 [Flavobacterium sp. LHD-80]|uniref:hypothetical protein n=1 Tax=Flavobacterium sp. LHD-80 TaxID=3071411 RepID=UPI0027DF7F55|nr:hypothetical protein [Flavobacterium sp. LHD-80]MDQ6469903.1 hypothetical protein [Flavobacterium sp. LHD-80]
MTEILKLLLLVPLISCGQEKSETGPGYPDYVGDIGFNAEMDNKDFELCFEKHIFQYFNTGNGLEYDGEKSAIEKEFAEKYKSEIIKNETGLIRINFVVSCKGKTDRFRLIGMDENYNEKFFVKSITEQLMGITKSLKGWKGKKYSEKEIDYYQYLIFKIENGQLKEILP